MKYSQFIDVDNMKNAMRIYRALARLKSTLEITKPANYTCGTVQGECFITLETTMNEKELDNWLYTRKAGTGYIGNGYLVLFC